ncbi:unnamed protein product, partial [Vitis vinifera]
MTIAGTPGGPESPLLEDIVDGYTDHKGRPARRSTSGCWRSAYFIIGVEVAERFAYSGIQANLINYLTGRLGLSMATAAENVNTWSGTGGLLPLVGAFVADSYLGRYRTIIIASFLYILGLGLLTLSAVLPSPSPSDCQKSNQITSCSPPQLQIILFFFSLYLVAVGQGGHKPCNQAFGADQFDGRNPEECKAKSSFFNWWYFGLCFGTVINYSVLSYIQENLNWGLGFGIPCVVMIAALLLFLLGTRTYRYSVKTDEKSPFVRIGKVFIAAAKNWRTMPSLVATEELAREAPHHQVSQQFKCLNKALLAPDGSKGNGRQCTIDNVEEAKAVLRLFPIWTTCLVYAIAFAQSSTFFTKQGITMDRSIGWGIDIPASSLQGFIGLSIVLIVPIYDRILVPIARTLTRKPSGITMLQRIGTGMFLSAISMVVAALVEMKRLKTAQEHGLVDMPNVTLPMSVWWLLPQYILFGVSDVVTIVGLQEFFYDQVPTELRSVGIALYLSILGVGNFLSSFLISAIEKATGGDGQHSWFNDNLNRAHLDNYYWVLAGLSAVGLSLYLYFAKSYIYNRGKNILPGVFCGWNSQRPPISAAGRHSRWLHRLQGPSSQETHFRRLEIRIFHHGAEVAERFAYFGIQSNLINFFTDRLGQSNPTAGESVNIWTGTGSLMPLVGAFVADSYLGRYATIINASLLYILGLVLLTLSAVFPALSPSNCPKRNKTISCSPQLQIIFFFLVIFSGSWARWAQVLHPGFWSRPI